MANPARVAHFLFHSELAESPPNDALVRAWSELGCGIDFYAPAGDPTHPHHLGPPILPVEYGPRWLLQNAWRPAWRRYAAFSCTTENPAAVAGTLARVHRRPLLVLADEIRAGAYRGNTSESWKRRCHAAMRRADLTIVNDDSRVSLQRDYTGLPAARPIVVYPGGYLHPPAPVDRATQRAQWGFAADDLVLGFSGAFSTGNGGHWFVEAIQRTPGLRGVAQPLWVDEMTRFLLPRIEGRERLYVEPRRLHWHEAWSQAAALDIGLAIYLQPGAQFQLMGTSSNRLCMFLAMGVPVIASRQASFQFLEEYDCGVLVDSAEELRAAVDRIAARLDPMKANAKRCWGEHARTEERYQALVRQIGAILR
jgi:glycosyltransferase involved in cell wall biosynthesis